ncbi:MAG: carboxymuconolactone decarboxylase family protein [Planctomycetota bacterium]|jgi:4-carboxymuconolactone decarboxylase|nr:carboxymuconolactone decarboxylase family protein [Planctomycetota bacterium]
MTKTGKHSAEIMMILMAAACRFCGAARGESGVDQREAEMNAVRFEQIFPLGEKNDDYAQYFTGQSYIKRLAAGDVFISNVTFEPGGRNNWHIHRKGGQILLCTAGYGWYQEEGKPARELRPGDVVSIPEGVKHWHGGAKDSWFSHLALSVPVAGASTDWLEPVGDEVYLKLAANRGRADKSKKTIKKLSVGEDSLSALFPEFAAIKNRFLYGEVWSQGSLDDHLRALVTIAALTTVEGMDLEEQLHAALKIGVLPSELQEVFHQAAPYVGFAKAEKGLAVLGRVLRNAGVDLPLAGNATVTEENRLHKGVEAQKAIFGEMIDAMRANAPDDLKFIQDYLSAYCFGDTYTRNGLDLKTRELITFTCLAALGDCAGQLKSHTAGNLAVGNGREVLLGVLNQSLPYIGFPRTLNAVAMVNEIAK